MAAASGPGEGSRGSTSTMAGGAPVAPSAALGVGRALTPPRSRHSPYRKSRSPRASRRLKLAGYAAAPAESHVPLARRPPPTWSACVVCVQRSRSSESSRGARPEEYMSVVYFWNGAPKAHIAKVHIRAAQPLRRLITVGWHQRGACRLLR